MVFVPGKKLLTEMNMEETGLWFGIADNETEVSIVVKLPTNVIKALYQDALSELIISIVEIEQSRVRMVSFKVYDIPGQPIATSYPIRKLSEHTWIEESLKQEQVLAHFFDERTRPVLSTTCYFDSVRAKETLSDLVNTKPHYTGGRGTIIRVAHDFFQKDQTAIIEGKASKALVNQIIPLTFADIQIQDIDETGTGRLISYRLDNETEPEGKTFEKHIYLGLASVYSTNIFYSPQVPKSKSDANLRELTDVLGFDSGTICLIESKGLPVLKTGIDRSAQKVNTTIKKNIKKGLGQLKGAVRNIRAKMVIYDENGKEINVPNRQSSIIHAIVLISEMLVDGEAVAIEIFKIKNQDQNTFYHVMDFRQFQRLIVYSRGKIAHFNSFLLHRWQAATIKKNANVNFKFSPYE